MCIRDRLRVVVRDTVIQLGVVVRGTVIQQGVVVRDTVVQLGVVGEGDTMMWDTSAVTA